MSGRFVIRERPAPPLAKKQGCSCGGSVLVRKQAAEHNSLSDPGVELTGNSADAPVQSDETAR